jgi:hypothetical protein
MIRFFLLHRIEWTDEHPGLMFACLGAAILLAGVLESVMP